MSAPAGVQSQPEALEKSLGEESSDDESKLNAPKPIQTAVSQRTSVPTSELSQPSLNTSNHQNFSRPTAPYLRREESLQTFPPAKNHPPYSANDSRTQVRKLSHAQGFFEPSLPSSSILSSGNAAIMATSQSGLSASQIAAQAAMQHQGVHQRQRSQTLPLENPSFGQRRSSRGPVSPPLLSLTEASSERPPDCLNTISPSGQVYRNGLLGGSTNPAATAASVVFQRSPQSSPVLPPTDVLLHREIRSSKADKPSKVKLFSRPGKIGLGKELSKDRGLASPSKLSSYVRNNISAQSLADSTISGASSLYSVANSSTATIKPIETASQEKDKDKEKKHHFLSRQKHKLSGREEHHLPLSSAASNSRLVDPNASSTLYSFNLPPSPGPNTTSFAKSMSGLDLRHGGRALRERKKEEKLAGEPSMRDTESTHSSVSEWQGPSSLGSVGAASFLGPPSTGHTFSIHALEPQDLGRYGLNNMTADDAWPLLKARLLIVFEGEDLRLPVEDLNKLVCTHIRSCIAKRIPHALVEDLRDLFVTGFGSLDQTLRRIPDEKLIPHLTEMWLFTFTSILPYMQAVFLPLDLEFAGCGTLFTSEKAREFWGFLPAPSISYHSNISNPDVLNPKYVLDVRRIVLTAFRDIVIVPRFEILNTLFSRLSLENINIPVHSDKRTTSPERPSTAMSLDPSLASYTSQGTTLLGEADGKDVRSRAISNVSHGSDTSTAHFHSFQHPDKAADPLPPGRPFTPAFTKQSLLGLGLHAASNAGNRDLALREANAEDSKHVTEMAGRLLQCMSVVASVGVLSNVDEGGWEAQRKMEELCKSLKLNWLGRGRTGRNRRGMVAARVRKEEVVSSML